MRPHNKPNSAHNQHNPSAESFNPETIVRIQRHERNYLTVANATVQDPRLSFETLGLLIYLLSLPADWVIRVRHLQTRGGKWDEEKGENQGTGRDSVRRMLRELQTFGYLSGVGRDSQERGERGRFGQNEITVYETPDLNPFHVGQSSPSPENPSTVAQPSADSPSPDSPSPENQSTYKEQNPQTTQRTKSHTQTKTRLRAVRAPAGSADAGVSVGSSKSSFSFEERKAHADRNGLGSGWLQRSRSGEYDELIADQLARRTPEAIEQALSTPAPKFKPYGAALMHVASVVSRGGVGSEPLPEIERLFESGQIDEATRARLMARDWTK